MVFSPSESHCATCGDDGSVRVWSLASMELVIQFQVLNQVLGAPGLEVHVVSMWSPYPGALTVHSRALAAASCLQPQCLCGLGAGPLSCSLGEC